MRNKYLALGVIIGWVSGFAALHVYVFVAQILFRIDRIEQFLIALANASR